MVNIIRRGGKLMFSLKPGETPSPEDMLRYELIEAGADGVVEVQVMGPHEVRLSMSMLTFAYLDAVATYFKTKKINIVAHGELEKKDLGSSWGETSCYGVETRIDVLVYEATVPEVFVPEM